jgi:citrate lyase subunit beta/citryl-CoA lyase
MANPRSFLFVPGDSEKKLAKADASGADALILDLEDSVAPSNKATARQLVADFLRARARPRPAPRSQLWVRINALDTGLATGDLAAVVAAAPDGVMLPKANGPEDVVSLSRYLDDLEVKDGVVKGSIKIVSLATETPIAPFRLGDYATAKLDRLLGLSWGAEDLSAALGATTNRDASGEWSFTYQLVRSLCLLAARAANVQAIETVFVDFKDEAGFRASCRAARAEGFTGRLAIHPAQIRIINECFLPSTEEVEQARRVVAAFRAATGAGVVALDGKMFDVPHLKQAQAVLAQVEAYAKQ